MTISPGSTSSSVFSKNSKCRNLGRYGIRDGEERQRQLGTRPITDSRAGFPKPEDPNFSVWLLLFYDQVLFLCQTVQPEVSLRNPPASRRGRRKRLPHPRLQ